MPRPYMMCSEEECRERQEAMEISEWEATEDTYHAAPKYRVLDPRLAVSKYRRSAAGTKQRPPRRVIQLLETWKHLLGIALDQRVHEGQPPASFASTVSFVDDRVRAIQVDLVISQKVSCGMQLQLVRYQLVALYILSNVPRNIYEPKFARQALMTAMVAYWNDTANRSHDDEMLCYTTLCHVAASLNEDAWVDVDEILATYRKHAQGGISYPKFAFALEISAAACMQNYWIIFKLLSQNDSSFNRLCRICLAPCLDRLRWLCLAQYNKAWTKQEKIDPEEMTRLLYLPNSDATVKFCTLAGLPMEDGKLVFKAAPIRELSSYKSLREHNDWFCFGPEMSCRNDEDSVEVPSPQLLRELILQ